MYNFKTNFDKTCVRTVLLYIEHDPGWTKKKCLEDRSLIRINVTESKLWKIKVSKNEDKPTGQIV